MEIRLAKLGELSKIIEVYNKGRSFMRSYGNFSQWMRAYPSEEDVKRDIEKGNFYVLAEGDKLLAVFAYIEGIDETYIKIDGKWLNDKPYGVIHRLSVAESGKGIASLCYDYCFQKCKNLRIDTHECNTPMLRSLEKNGFKFCGIIYVQDGTPRRAYQKV